MHDLLGRISKSVQTTGGVQASPFVYTLSPADQLTAIRYPTGRTLNLGLEAGGRLASLIDAGSGKTYVSGFGYNPDSSVNMLTMGNKLKENYTYNDRLQVTNFAVGPATGVDLRLRPDRSARLDRRSRKTSNQDPRAPQKLDPRLRGLLFQAIFVMQARQDWPGIDAVSSRYLMPISAGGNLVQRRFRNPGAQGHVWTSTVEMIDELFHDGAHLAFVDGNHVGTLTMGNTLKETYTYNDRLQLTNFRVSPVSGADVLKFDFYPCSGTATACPTGNTGNIQSQAITVPVSGGSTVTKTQTYGYDALNRLTGMSEGAGAPSQTYSYRANHNMFVATNDNSTFAMSAFTPTSASAFDAVNNRLGINNAIYDSSGTGTQTGIGGYTNAYDAENRITTSKLTASVGFSYDGLGQRIQKINCPGGENPCVAASANAVVTTFLYDSSGNLAVESGAPLAAGADGLAMCGTVTCYLSVDQVGSTRLVTDSTGAAVRRYDYLPYGQEIPVAGSGWRTTSMGYAIGPDGFSIKYTGQYRDPETGLDYFNARYYSPAQGRFVSPDPGNAGANLGDSATWNGYAYVGGNPVNVTDPSGLGFWSDLGGFFAGIFGSGSFGSLGLNDGPWNEQVPGGGTGGGSLGGALNTGGVFGQGQINPFVFSFADLNSKVAPFDVPIDNPYFPALLRGIQISSPVVEPKNIAKFYVTSAVAGYVAVQMAGLSTMEVAATLGAETGATVIEAGAARFAARALFRIPLRIIFPAAVAATEGAVARNSFFATCDALLKGWGLK